LGNVEKLGCNKNVRPSTQKSPRIRDRLPCGLRDNQKFSGKIASVEELPRETTRVLLSASMGANLLHVEIR
jgi:hypothetical protein